MMTIRATFAAVLACTAIAAPAVQGADLVQPVSVTRTVDLTHEMHEEMAFWPGGVPFEMERLVDYDQGYRLHKFVVGENTGTHVDAPAHFIEGAQTIDEIPLSDLIVPAVVIDVQDKVAGNADYQLTPDDIEEWESEHGRIPADSFVILNTGWHKRFNTPEEYVNMDDDDVMHFPGYHPDSAEVLIERGVAGVGIDTLSLDYGASTSFGFHGAMLDAGIYQVENLANLNAVPATGWTVMIGVLPVREGTQAQARIVALLP